MKKISLYVFVSLILACSYIIGILKFLSENEEDRCEMTYMFEYPQYVKISNKADKEFRKYGLYAYSEGRLTERTRNMYFDGIPVLFIPGNAGSHKQVRSLSSVALRKWMNSRTSYHFDYFAVDLNEEYSGLYGPLLFDQLRYVNASLYRILELYADRQKPPESVVVVGHSMGGIIAMKLLSELEQPELISVLITLASPLKRAAMSLDYHMNKFYEGIFDEDFSATTVVSLAGGYKDILMHPHFTKRQNNEIIHVSTSHIPMSWTESNHVQILWCKQVVMALNRALFDSVDMKTRLISTNTTYRNEAFKHHLIKNSGTKVKNHEQYSKLVTINTKGKWIDDIRKVYSIEYPRGLHEPHWNMVGLSDLPGYEILTVLAVNLEVTDWIFACNAYYIQQTSRACQEGFHLSHKSEIAPSVKHKRRFFHINMKYLKQYRNDLSHIVFRALPTNEPVKFHVDIHGLNDRNLTVNLPGVFSFSKQTILERTPENALSYEVALPALNNIIQYYRLFLEPIECLKMLLTWLDEGMTVTAALKKITVKDVSYWIASAWDDVRVSTLQKPWRKLFQIEAKGDGKNNNSIAEIVDLANQLPTELLINDEDVNEWIMQDQQMGLTDDAIADMVKFHVDIHGLNDRNLTVNLPGVFSFSKQTILERTPENALSYEVALPALNNIIQYYRLFLEPIECLKSDHHASVTLTVPWSNENYHGFITNNMKKPFNIRLYSSKPFDLNNATAKLKIILDPSCRYKISVQSSLFGVLGQLARTYTPLLVANLAVIALMSLRHQLITLEDGYCSIIFTAIQEGAKPYYVFCVYVLLSRLLSLPFLPDILLKPDHIYLVGDGVDFFLIPLFLYTCSVGFFWILIVLFSISLIAMESTVHKLSLKLLARSVSFNMAWSDYLMSYLHKVPVVVALTLISLSLTTCGGLALCLGAMFYFLRLTQMSQDFVEEIVWFIGKKIARRIKSFFSRNKNKPENQIVALTPVEDTNKHISLPHNIKQITGAPENESDEDDTEDDTEEKLLESEETEETDIEVLEPDMVDKNMETDEGTDQKHKIVQAQCELEDKETETNPEVGVQVKLEEKVQNMGDGDITKDLNLNQTSNSSETEEKTNIDSQLLQISSVSGVKHETSANEVEDKSKDKKTEDPELSSAYNAIFFHSTLFFLWCIITVINVPAVLTWAHSFKYSTVLEADSSFIPGFTLSICALILWQFEFPRTNRKWMKELQKFVLLMAIICLLFASISIYRISYILMLTIVVVTLHQVFAPQEDDSVIEEDDDERTRYSDLKAKME
uniref:GPI inositol-deacylase n=1 Tax=Diabrotica virgifera virgifera TaxID=50390 RepID=A0A6P7GD64_DIAVI